MFEGPAGPDLAVALAACDLSQVDGGARIDALVAAGRLASWAQSMLLCAMAAVADRSPDDFAGDEVAFSLHLTRRGAETQVALARDLRDRLPAVLAALAEGRIDVVRARVFSDVLTPAADPIARHLVEKLLPKAEGWTAGQLRARLLKELLAADPDAAATRYRRSVAERRVYLGGNDDTTANLSAIFLPPQRAAAAYERVDAIARGLKKNGDQRTLDQLRADVFCDLLSGVAIPGAPIDRQGVIELLVPLETLTGQAQTPGHLNGYGPVVADIARQVAAAQAAQGVRGADDALAAARVMRPADTDTPSAGSPADDASPTPTTRSPADGAGPRLGVYDGGTLPTTAATAGLDTAPAYATQWRYRVYDTDDGRLLYTGLTYLRPRTGSLPENHPTGADATPAGQAAPPLPGMPTDQGPPAEPQRRDQERREQTPQVMPCHALPEAPGVLRIRPLPANPPPPRDPTARYPSAPMRRWIAARDTTCRAPGCTHPARTCDIDHTHDHHDGGPTTDDNLGLLCRHHHRLKHETDHHVQQTEPGTFRWTTPHGKTHDVTPDTGSLGMWRASSSPDQPTD
ncbi:MAG: DUF222 domain-containing protein [Hamadaea sp.]|nr:DUF222 domain-containing protein [Hamadaea sp.]